MPSLNDDKAALLAAATHLATSEEGTGNPPPGDVEDLLAAFYRHVAPEDVSHRSAEDLWGALRSMLELGASRPEGTAVLRVFTPTVGEHGWSAGGHSLAEIVTEDMPFLIDSVSMALAAHGRTIHSVIHPRYAATRDITGALKHLEVATRDAVTDGATRESWMHFEIDRVGAEQDLVEIETALQDVLRDVRDAVEDWPRMRARMLHLVDELREHPISTVSTEETRLATQLLEWLAHDHFAFLGYREYTLREMGDELSLAAVPGTGLGILRADQEQSKGFMNLPRAVREKAREKTLLVLAKANSRATVHRSSYLDYIGVKSFDEAGNVVGERRFLGLFSSAAYTDSVTNIPLLREKVQAVLDRVGVDSASHTGKSLLNVIENYPRDELFHTPIDELVPIAESIIQNRERRQLRLFTRRDTYGRYLSCLVFLPRDRYNTSVRERMAAILTRELDADGLEFSVRLNENYLAQVHFVVRPPRGELLKDVDLPDLEKKLAEAARSWRDDLIIEINKQAGEGEEGGSRLAARYADAFPEAYKEDFSAQRGAMDVSELEGLQGEDAIDLGLYDEDEPGRGQMRLKIFRAGAPLRLSQVLPMLSSMGVEVIDERPYELEGMGRETTIYEFGLSYPADLPEDFRELFTDALRAIWDGYNEIDGFNGLVLGAGLSWREATVLRALAKYMRQGNSPFGTDYIEQTLQANGPIARLLVQFFVACHDPAADEDTREATATAVGEEILRALDAVASLDHDRILRSYLAHLKAVLRTNYFQPGTDGSVKPYISFKLDPAQLPDLPQPRPKFEIFVYSPRVEGVHLRFGSVARGGLRWSDRRDDFRTEVLGLVKAQMVKNTVIVPVGAKGGFFCKQLPDPSVDRDAWLAEGIACYKTFVSGLLDITDNLVHGEPVPPAGVVRHDGNDPYLVVAADKGTATFSDIANGLAKEYGFWLGDAFASGGSVGYDHKAMGITARGAWVSVQRHFRERGIDCQTEPFTCVGIGDMSGDVFGNGMLCSPVTKLVAAFDHRHIFLDPAPDPATSYAERQRMFALPRSSWEDYDHTLISDGGGVYSRALKSIALNDAVRKALGIDAGVESMTPAELMKAILLAPVDLLWNGGIGTYVKASSEPHTAAGDKANDAIRVNGGQLRAKCIGEGGNLGCTQLGRIEYAQTGGRVNTDFIDNSAGVDTSDHEVNIKILLDRVVQAGGLAEEHRNRILADMTDEVAALVLRDNYEQNLALANAAANGPALLHVHEDWMRELERRGVLDRELEGLPGSHVVRQRLERNEGLTVPELSVLLAWTKIVLAEELLGSELPEDPFLHADLFAYFPSLMRQDYRPQMLDHPLRREIIVTQVVNDLVNGAGMTFWHRLSGETGATAAELTNANFVAREIFGSLALRDEVKALDNRIDASLQTLMRLEMRTLVERASRWLVNNRRAPLDSEGIVEFFEIPVQRVMGELPGILSGQELAAYRRRRDRLIRGGVAEELAVRVAALAPSYHLLGVVETATRKDYEPAEVARVHFGLGERLGLPRLMGRILNLPRHDRWQTMARAALRDDVYAAHADLTAQVLATTSPGTAAERISEWVKSDEAVVSRSVASLAEICSDEHADLARMSVGLRVMKGMLVHG